MLDCSALIFDLDGTLADTLADIGNAANQTLTEANLATHALSAYRSMIGGGVRALLQNAAPAGCADLDGLVERFRTRYAAQLLETTVPYPGISRLIGELASRGVPLAVLSNKPHPLTCRIIAALFPDQPFLEVRGDRACAARKPDPTEALAIAASLGVPAARCGLVGDSVADMQAARNAGMAAIAVSWGFGEVAELTRAGATVVVDTPAAIRSLLFVD